MGAVITRLRRGRKKRQASKNKQKRKKGVVVKKGSLTRASKTSVRNSRRSHSQRSKSRKERKPLTEVFTNANTDETTHGSVKVTDKDQPVMDLASTQPNDSQRSKKMSIKRKKSTGTQRSKNKRQPLNDIAPKAEDATDGGKIVDNNTQQRGTKFRASQRSKKGSVRRRRSSRKLKKHLFPSPAVFNQIDAHAIKAGEEVRLFSLSFDCYLKV